MSKIVAKRVSNYELFYDLVFVLAISRLVTYLHTASFHLANLTAFIGSTSVLLSIWMYQTIYLNKYGERDPLDVYLNIPAMFLVGNFALMLGITSYGLKEFILYNVLLILSHVLIVLQYYLRGRQRGFNPDMLASMKRLGLIIGYLIILVILSLIFFRNSIGQASFNILWVLPWLSPFFYSKETNSSHLNFPHMVERFQLITIISFGETVVGLIQTYPLYHSPLLGLLFFFGISFMFVAYVSQTHLAINHHQVTRGLILTYAHLFLILALNMVTAAIEILANPHHTSQGLGLLSIGLFVYYLALYSTSIYNRRLYRFAKTNYLPYMICMLLGIVLMWLLHSWTLAIACVFAATCFIVPRLNFYARRQARERAKSK